MKVKDLAYIALFIALSFVLSNFRLYGSVSFDSIPAFLALVLWKDYKAGIIGGIGHLIVALMSGFVFGLATHFIIAFLMFSMLIVASVIIKKSSVLITFIFIYIVNALLMPFSIFVTIPFNLSLYLSLALMLSITLVANFIVTYVLYKPIGKVIERVENNYK